jgi:hypothetical protein
VKRQTEKEPLHPAQPGTKRTRRPEGDASREGTVHSREQEATLRRSVCAGQLRKLAVEVLEAEEKPSEAAYSSKMVRTSARSPGVDVDLIVTAGIWAASWSRLGAINPAFARPHSSGS